MAETLPRYELVMDNLLATLAGVTVANNYQVTLNQVTRNTPVGTNRDTNSGVIVDQGVCVRELDQEDADESPLQTRDYWLPIELLLAVFEPDDSLYPPRRRLQLMRADIIKALLADVSRGGNAQDTVVRPYSWVLDADAWGAVDGMSLPIRIRYREDYFDPYVLR